MRLINKLFKLLVNILIAIIKSVRMYTSTLNSLNELTIFLWNTVILLNAFIFFYLVNLKGKLFNAFRLQNSLENKFKSDN